MKKAKTKKVIYNVIEDTLYKIRKDSDYNVHISVGYKVRWRNIYIYTNKPGYLIGLRGKTFNEMQGNLIANGVNKKLQIIEIGDYYAREITFTLNPFVILYRKLKRLFRKD